LFLGACIGAAFIGGWTIARNPITQKEPPVALTSRPAAQSGLSEAEAPPNVLQTPVSPISIVAPDTFAPTPEETPPPAAPAPVAPAPASVPSPTPASVPSAEVALPEPAQLSITTEPDAKVKLLDGTGAARTVGTADVVGRLLLVEPMRAQFKVVTLIFEHADCLEEERAGVELIAGKTTTIMAPLRYRPGVLAIVAEPTTADVFLNGALVGRGFVMVGEVVSRKPHVVEVRAAGLEPVKRTVVVHPGASTVERVSLVPSPADSGDILFLGTMLDLISRKDVTVRMDNASVSTQQGLIRNVVPGQHTLTVLSTSSEAGAVAQVLWERKVTIEPGAATSLGNEDAPVAAAPPPPKVKAVATAPVPPPPAADVDTKRTARLWLTLLDGNGRAIPAGQATASFDGTVVPVLRSGVWLLPLGKKGTLRVEVAGFATEEIPVHFSVADDYRISRVLHPTSAATAPSPAAAEGWTARVMAVSESTGLLVLRDLPDHPVKAGNKLTLVPPVPGRVEVVRLKVDEVKDGLVVCQILPGKTRLSLPDRGHDVKVRFTLPPTQ
jgi:hypothetical protein